MFLNIRAEMMRSEAVRRFQLLVLWSILISLGAGFPTKSRNFAHKVSSLLRYFSLSDSLYVVELRNKLKVIFIIILTAIYYLFLASSYIFAPFSTTITV